VISRCISVARVAAECDLCVVDHTTRDSAHNEHYPVIKLNSQSTASHCHERKQTSWRVTVVMTPINRQQNMLPANWAIKLYLPFVVAVCFWSYDLMTGEN